MLLGELLGFAGDRLPIIKAYLGGGAILALFGAAAMVYFGWLPAAVADDVASFMKGGGFLDFYIAALITGSILGMDAKVMVKVGPRYALQLLCSCGSLKRPIGWIEFKYGSRSPSLSTAHWTIHESVRAE